MTKKFNYFKNFIRIMKVTLAKDEVQYDAVAKFQRNFYLAVTQNCHLHDLVHIVYIM